MSHAFIAACIWVVAGSIVALLPMWFQIVPGLALLVSAPVILVWLVLTHGCLPLVIGLLVIISMFRRPLGALWRYLNRRFRGEG